MNFNFQKLSHQIYILLLKVFHQAVIMLRTTGTRNKSINIIIVNKKSSGNEIKLNLRQNNIFVLFKLTVSYSLFTDYGIFFKGFPKSTDE